MTRISRTTKPSEAGEKTPLWQSAWFNTLGRFLALAVVFLFFAVVVKEGKFYSLRNLESILLQSAVYATAAFDGLTNPIFVVDVATGAETILTLGGWKPAWSRAGSSIAFTRRAAGRMG